MAFGKKKYPSACGGNSYHCYYHSNNIKVMEKKNFAVSGMKCVHCKARVEEAIRALDGVASAEGNLAEASVAVEYDPTRLSPQQIKDAVDTCGRYELTL